jgi:hypothetical protein
MSATVIRLPERPFPSGWEQWPHLDDDAHTWETVYAEDYPGKFIELDRCVKCHIPRCERTDDDGTRCTERRHHLTVHIFESGRFEPVGGYLCDENGGAS